MREVEITIETKMENMFQQLKNRVDEKAVKQDMDKALKLKANNHVVNRQL